MATQEECLLCLIRLKARLEIIVVNCRVLRQRNEKLKAKNRELRGLLRVKKNDRGRA